MSGEIKILLCLTGLAMGAVGLGLGLTILPFQPTNQKFWLCAIAGVVPLAFLSAINRRKYLSFIIFISGMVGLTLVARYIFDCTDPSKSCVPQSPQRLWILGVSYLLLLIGGWIWIQAIARKQKAQDDPP